jgi:hypothetical protein
VRGHFSIIQYALGDTPEQRYMGQWSDGTAVLELKATTQA